MLTTRHQQACYCVQPAGGTYISREKKAASRGRRRSVSLSEGTLEFENSHSVRIACYGQEGLGSERGHVLFSTRKRYVYRLVHAHEP